MVVAGTYDGFMGYDLTIHEKGKASILASVEEVCPGVMDSRIVNHITGLRPSTRDLLPILGEIPGLEGGYIATGHRRLGITLSAITGELISQLVLGKPTRLPLDAYRLDRFDGTEDQQFDSFDAAH